MSSVSFCVVGWLLRLVTANSDDLPPLRDLMFTNLLPTPFLSTEIWNSLRRVKNYEQVAGTLLFQKLFVKAPQTKVLFGFPIDIDPMSEEVAKSRRFVMHAAYLIEMIDTALQMLGPDIELLTEIMLELGTKHIRYGVKPAMFPIMGECLIETLEETLGEMQPDVKEAWIETYDALSGDMVKAQLNVNQRRSGSNSG